MRPTVSLVMIVKDEERFINRCLSSAASYVDELIVVDTGSSDQTMSIAASYGAKLFDYPWSGDFAAARNFALDQSSCDWCLVLDADEYIINDCREAFQEFIAQERAVGIIKRIDAFEGTDGINEEQIYIGRLFPSECRYTGAIHEQLITNLPAKRVGIDIYHDGYLGQTKSSRNIPILVKMIEAHPQDPYFHYQIAKEYRGLKEHDQAYSHLNQAYQNITRRERYAPSLIVNYLYAIIAAGRYEEGMAVIESEQYFLNAYPDFHFVSALFILELVSSDPGKYSANLPLIEMLYKRALQLGDQGQEGSVTGTGSFAAHHNLGVYYETTGQMQLALEQYRLAAAYDYVPSIQRLNELSHA